VIALAWAPADGNGAHASTSTARHGTDTATERRGPTVAVVAAFGAELEWAARLVALLAVQLDADDLRDQWPIDDHVGLVGELLAADASRRQGADPPRPST
jgi:hypothetical protein